MRPRVALMSFWKNDSQRFLEERAAHLLAKTYPNLRWIWSVGDCHDNTLELLRKAAGQKDVEFVDSTTNIVGNDIETRLRRLSVMATLTFRHIRDGDDFVLVHESDLESPPDVIERLLAAGKAPIAAWPILKFRDGAEVFYDIWAFHRYGEQFRNKHPYHFSYVDRIDDVFEVDGFGSVYMIPGPALRDMVVEKEAVREICRNLRKAGHRLWVDCSLVVTQPEKTWESHVGTPLRNEA